MREFRDIASFVKHMASMPAKLDHAATEGLRHASELVETEAKKSIGHYQEAAGPFSAWAPLSDATLDGFVHPLAGRIPGKIELGYASPGQDNPLEREGHLRESISHIVQGHEASVGSDDEVMIYQELGTPNARYPIPPRSVLGGAAVRETAAVIDALAGTVALALAGLPPRGNRSTLERLGADGAYDVQF